MPWRRDDLPGARLALGALVSRPTAELDSGLAAAAAIESLAENVVDSWLAPLLAYALGGLPLAYAYRAANTADAMWGYRGTPYEHLGKVAARLDDALNWLPARFASVLICARFRGAASSLARVASRCVLVRPVRTPASPWRQPRARSTCDSRKSASTS